MWPCEALREVERALDVVVLPLERTLVALLAVTHAEADLEHLLQHLVALFQWREGKSRPACLLFVIAGSDPEPRTTARKNIQCGHRLREQDRLPVGRRRRHGDRLDPPGVDGQESHPPIPRHHLLLCPPHLEPYPTLLPPPVPSPL